MGNSENFSIIWSGLIQLGLVKFSQSIPAEE